MAFTISIDLSVFMIFTILLLNLHPYLHTHLLLLSLSYSFSLSHNPMLIPAFASCFYNTVQCVHTVTRVLISARSQSNPHECAQCRLFMQFNHYSHYLMCVIIKHFPSAQAVVHGKVTNVIQCHCQCT